MKIYNTKKIEKLKKIEKYFKIFILLRLPLLLIAKLIRLFKKNRPEFLLSEGFLIGDAVLTRGITKAVSKLSSQNYYLGIPQSEYIFDDIPIQIIPNQWPWANYNYKVSNLLKLLKVWLKIFLLQPKNILELRGDFRSILFLYLTCPEILGGFPYTGGSFFLDKRVDTRELLNIEEHTRLLAKEFNLDYDESYFIKKNKNPNTSTKKLGLSFSGSQILKRIPSSLAEIILNKLIDKKNLELVYIVSPQDHFYFENKNLILSKVHKVLENLSFKEYLSELENLNFYIGMDSGGAHLVSMHSTPSLIFYNTNFARLTKPMGNPNLLTLETEEELNCRPCDGVHCVHKEYLYCLKSIQKSKLETCLEKLFSYD